MVKTPILFETYTRVETARKVWDKIKAAKPLKLYFYSNKASDSRPDDIKRNNEIRSWVNEVDWNCEIHTFFRQEQVDVYTSLLSSKQWLFENEERGIILEDDLVPSVGFFQFCDYFLDYYEKNKKIFCISGDNYTNYSPGIYEDHIISRKGNVYGWATWKDRFDSVDFNFLPSDLTLGAFLKHFKGMKIHAFSQYMFYQTLQKFVEETHCWDYIWGMTGIQTNRYFVMPTRHLVKNIGTVGEHFNGNADENIIFTKEVDMESNYKFVESKERQAPIIPNDGFDKEFFRLRWPIKPILINYLKYRIKSLLKV